MKNLFLLLVIFVMNCKTSNYEKMDKSDILLYTTVDNDQIKMRFMNVGNTKIDFYTPCLTNTLIYFTKDNVKISSKVLLRRNCDAKIFTLRKNESKEFFCPRTISEEYTLVKGEKYILKIEYSIFEKGHTIHKIFSENYTFVY